MHLERLHDRAELFFEAGVREGDLPREFDRRVDRLVAARNGEAECGAPDVALRAARAGVDPRQRPVAAPADALPVFELDLAGDDVEAPHARRERHGGQPRRPLLVERLQRQGGAVGERLRFVRVGAPEGEGPVGEERGAGEREGDAPVA